MRDRTVVALGLLGLALLLTNVATLVVVLRVRGTPSVAQREPGPGASGQDAAAGAAPTPPEPSAWRPAPATWANAVDMAFSAGAALLTDGKLAVYEPGDGAARPLEVPAAIRRVFAASGALFAVGENDGAPFAIGLSPRESPMVVPMPCEVVRLAGEGEVVAGLCEDGKGVALSSDSGRSFRSVALEVPAPKGAEDAEIDRRLEAVAVSPAGAVLVALTQRWRTDGTDGALAWTLGQVALRPAGRRSLVISNVDSIARVVGAHLSGGTATLAGLQVALDGPGDGTVRTRLYRGTEGEPPVAVGSAGPSCGTTAQASAIEGVLLGSEVAFFVCGDRLVATLDGGATWAVDRSLGPVEVLRGGDMRLLARSGERVWERRFVGRSDSGATAVPAPSSGRSPGRGSDAGTADPVSPPYGIREPGDAGPGADATP